MRRICLYMVLVILLTQESFSQSCGHCSTCDVTLSGSSPYMSTKANEKICVLSGQTYTGNITLLHAGCTISVCGSWNLSMGWSPWNTYTLDVRNSVTFNGDHGPSQPGVVHNYSILTINGSQSLAPSNTFSLTNYAGATLTCKGINFSNSNRILDNYGTLDVNGTIQVATATSSIINRSDGTFTASGDIQLNSGSNLSNAGDLVLDGTGNKLDMNGSSTTVVNQLGGSIVIQDGDYETDAGSITTNEGELFVTGTNRKVNLNGGAILTNKGKISTYDLLMDGVTSTLNNYCWINVLNNYNFNNGVFNGPVSAGEIGAVNVAGVSTWTSGTFGQPGQTIDFCDAGNPASGWDNKNGHSESGTVTYCTTDAMANTEANCASLFLPVELLYFNITCSGKTGLLAFDWQTLSESNNDYFTIEGSYDGEQFESVVQVDGSGSSNRELLYSAVYRNDATPYSYYRLQQTDYNGESVEYKTVDAPICVENGRMNIFNNGQRRAVVKVPEDAVGFEEVSLLDMSGQLIYHGHTDAIDQINELFSEIPAGVYLLRITGPSMHRCSKILLSTP